MNATLKSHLSAAIVADRHSRAAQHRLANQAETSGPPAGTTDRTPARRRLRLRRVTA